MEVMILHQSEGVTNTKVAGGAYSTSIKTIYGLLGAPVGNSGTLKRKVRRALQSLQTRGLIRRDGFRSWCVVTPELEDMRLQRDEEFEAMLERVRCLRRAQG